MTLQLHTIATPNMQPHTDDHHHGTVMRMALPTSSSGSLRRPPPYKSYALAGLLGDTPSSHLTFRSLDLASRRDLECPECAQPQGRLVSHPQWLRTVSDPLKKRQRNHPLSGIPQDPEG